MRTIAVYALPILFAITLHEAAHAYAAKFFGDSTAYAAGRVSANPLRHIDPFGTVALPLGLYILSSTVLPGAFVFGYAKPVPVQYSALRNPRRDGAWVALAGPLANLAMAFLWVCLSLVLQSAGVGEPFPHEVARAGLIVNLLVFAFNLLPIPPLDGGRVLTSMLPARLAHKFAGLERYGILIVLLLVALGLLHYWLDPVTSAATVLIELLLQPLLYLLN